MYYFMEHVSSTYLLNVLPSENNSINDEVNSQVSLKGVLVTSSGGWVNSNNNNKQVWRCCYGMFL